MIFLIRKVRASLRCSVYHTVICLCVLGLGNGAIVRGEDAIDTGFLESKQVADLLGKIWRVTYRLSDLLTQVDVETYEAGESELDAFSRIYSETTDEIKILGMLRGRFEKSPENLFLAYDSREAVHHILDNIQGIEARMLSKGEVYLSRQLSEARKELASLEIPLESYLKFLLSNYRQLISVMESNLASCHQNLSFAVGNQASRTRMIPNRLPTRSRSIPSSPRPRSNRNSR